MDLKEYREGNAEQERIQDLLSLVKSGQSALDIGARDGYLSIKLTDFFSTVTALDLEKPKIDHPSIECTQGNVCSLSFSNDSFDLVLCTEVLEHIPTRFLPQACTEISRVAKRNVIIGVPYRQDTRVGRTTCYTCGEKNPPWGHVNVFDEARLNALFPELSIEQFSFVGENHSRTNSLSALLMDMAGNPYGTYSQEESCVNCGSKLTRPPERTVLQRVATRSAFLLNHIQSYFVVSRPNWIHVSLTKTSVGENKIYKI